MTFAHAPPESQVRGAADGDLLSVGRMKAKQGRLAEAEVDVRSALQSRLKALGKYNPQTTPFVMGLANILVEEGRYEEAEKLARTALDVNRTLNIADDAQSNAQILSQLGAILTFQRKLAGSRFRLCRARQGDREVGAAAARGAGAERLPHQRHVRLRANAGRP